MKKIQKIKSRATNKESLWKYLFLKRITIITYFITLLYSEALIIVVMSALEIKMKEENIGIIFLAMVLGALVVSIMMVIRRFYKHPEEVNGLCYKVLQKYENMDQFNRYKEIKECIENFKDTDGNCDLKTNVGVIEAAIEHDQAQSVVFPILITLITTLLFENGDISVFSVVGSFFSSVVLLATFEMVKLIPKNAFTKKIVEKIKEENSLK